MGLGPDLVQGYTETFQDTGGDAFALTQKSDEEVFRSYISVVHPPSFVDGQFHYFLCTGGEANLALGRLLAAADDEFHSRPDLAQVHGQAGKHPGSNTFGLANQAEEDVLGTDVVMVEPLRFVLGQR